ncbi:hypothetical protein RQP46_000359 [Phenoliferia psychrophenolica]
MSQDKGKAVERSSSVRETASVSLPLSFANSFWTEDYRTGYETLYRQLDAGVTMSDEIITNVNKRAKAERSFAQDLHPPALRPDGFGIDEGASLKMGLESLLSAAVQESRAHLQLADELIKSIAAPFEEWSEAHKGRIRSSQSLIETHLSAYEKKQSEVAKLKTAYDEACRVADAAEDELSFLKGTGNVSPDQAGSPRASEKSPPPPPPTSAPAPPPKSQDGSEDGLPDIDDDDETLVGRSGATGGSVFAALGRAVTVRRKQFQSAAANATAASAGSPTSKELPNMPFAQDPNVGAALDWSKSTFSALLEKVAGPQTGEGRSDKARKDAESTETRYKEAVWALDQLRLTLEETLSEHFAYTHRCEGDRLKAATSVLRSFHATVSSFPLRMAGSSEKVSSALQLIRPEKDVLAIVERLRTGPFQPRPTVYHSHYSEPANVAFGIDLRKFDETNTASSKVPPILTFLLEHISSRYASMPDAERRKAWLYETPLSAQHHLRSALNDPNTLDSALVEKFDLPVVASVTKLWLLELDVPLIIYSHYDEYRSLYPKRVGAEVVDVPAKAIADHIARLPPVHLEVLRVLIQHFATLIKDTKTDESDEVFLQKLALSVARCVLRPKVETSLTLDDRFPTLLLVDLVKNFDVIFHSADELKSKQREDRYKPRRQRTKPVDVRVSRSRIDASGSVDLGEGKKLLQQQRHGLASPPPPVPPIPAISIDPTALPPPSAPSGFISSPVASSPLETTVEEQEPTAPVPSAPILAPVAAAPAEVAPVDDSQAPVRGSGSLTRKEGVAGVRRGARGPRPLPSASSNATTSPVAAPSALPPQVEGEVEQSTKTRPDSFSRTRAGMESDA